MEQTKEYLRQMLSFLGEVKHNHIYKVDVFASKYSEWPIIRKELTDMEAMNVKDGLFGMDASVPLSHLQQMYSEKFATLEQGEKTRREEHRHRLWQDVWIALSVLISAIALIMTLTK